MFAYGLLGNIIHVVHVDVVITVIAKEHDSVLPRTGIGVKCIVDSLINQYLSLFFRSAWESSYSYVRQTYEC